MANIRLKEILSQRGITQKDFAEMLSKAGSPMSKQFVNNIVTGRQNPSWPTMEAIIKVLGIDLWELFVSREKLVEEDKQSDCFVPTQKLTALIEFRGQLFKASSIGELERMIADWKSEANK